MYGALCIVSLPIRCFQNSESCTLYMLYWRDIVPWSLQQRPAQRLEELGHTLSQTLLRTSAVQHNAKTNTGAAIAWTEATVIARSCTAFFLQI